MIIEPHKNVVVLTGAGISKESGIKTFRDENGLWENHRIEQVATPEGFLEDPELVYEFYNQRRAQLSEIKPNLAHLSLANFEKEYNGNFTLITQNVDDLHQRAGSKNIFAMHGELKKARCLETGDIFSWNENLDRQSLQPVTKKKNYLRPHICWFGEMPFFLKEINQAIKNADYFIAIGTSGHVYPAAAYVSMVPNRCIKVLINYDPPLNEKHFDHFFQGKATELVPKVFQ